MADAPAPSARLTRARETLAHVFGFADFRPGQDSIIEAVLAGEDVLAVMPTGAGKSLCYQLPAILHDGLTVVVSPLIALMRNQVAQLRGFGIPAGALNSSNGPGENTALLEAAASGDLKLLYIAPERLAMGNVVEMVRAARVSLLAVDEAHCISQWGHDFRPDYLGIGDLADKLADEDTGKRPQIIALTATADEATRTDIRSRLFPGEPRVFVHGFDRPNIHLAIRPKASAPKQLREFILERKGQSGVVYCNSRKQTEELADRLSSEGIPALAYHAGMDADRRSRVQDTFLQEDGQVIAATVAFGMGIDKPDVRFVAHAGLPKNVESYYQEIGRAGRDGLPADTLTLYGMDDVRLRRMQIEESDASEDQKRIDIHRLNALIALCEAPRCRRQTLLSYFGETSDPCGNCDLCQDGVELMDGTIPAQMALSAIYRTGQRFATEHLIAVLRGEKTEGVSRWNHDTLKTFGVGTDYSRNEWRSIFRQLSALGIIAMDITAYGRWTITEQGREVLGGRQRIELRKESLKPTKKAKETRSTRTAAPTLEGEEQGLFDALKARRMALAKAEGVPAYVVFPDRTLIELARARPATEAEMGAVHGVGAAKLARYGTQFLTVIRDYQSGTAPS